MNHTPRGPLLLVGAWRPRTRGLAAVVVVVMLGLALGKDAARTAGVLGQLAAVRIQDWHNHEQALGVAGAGREGLPATVTATVAALNASGRPAFRLSPGIEQDSFLRQRIAEVAWPLPIDPAATLVVRLVDEASSCAPLAQTAGVAVDRCD